MLRTCVVRLIRARRRGDEGLRRKGAGAFSTFIRCQPFALPSKVPFKGAGALQRCCPSKVPTTFAFKGALQRCCPSALLLPKVPATFSKVPSSKVPTTFAFKGALALRPSSKVLPAFLKGASHFFQPCHFSNLPPIKGASHFFWGASHFFWGSNLPLRGTSNFFQNLLRITQLASRSFDGWKCEDSAVFSPTKSTS